MNLFTRKNWLNFGSHPPLKPDPGTFLFCNIVRLHTFSQFAHLSEKKLIASS